VEGWNPSPTDPNAGSGKYGTCCTELDIWEANMDATQLTPHVCRDPAGTQYRCQGDSCGDDASNERYDGLCDKDGGDWNPFRLGQTNFWGPGSQYTVDSTKPVTVVTQFITHDGTDTGDLSGIKRFYIQNGKQINSTAWNGYDSITDDYITAAKTKFNDTKSFEPRGGMKRLGDVMESNGMVLVMSIWDDHAVNMVWLDATDPPGGTALGDKRGRCSEQSGKPATLEKEHPNSKVIFSDIRSGEIGSTTGNSPGPSPGPAPSGCPGGSLSACMALCPSTPPAAYKACVQDCVNRCP
jgi:cellulose 1,4-beta-cellobiosidase